MEKEHDCGVPCTVELSNGVLSALRSIRKSEIKESGQLLLERGCMRVLHRYHVSFKQTVPGTCSIFAKTIPWAQQALALCSAVSVSGEVVVPNLQEVHITNEAISRRVGSIFPRQRV